MRAVAAERPRFGYRRVHVMLLRKGFRVGQRRVRRLYRLDGLAVRRRKRKRLGDVVPGRGASFSLEIPEGVRFIVRSDVCAV